MTTAISIKPTPADEPLSWSMKLLVRDLLPDVLVRYRNPPFACAAPASRKTRAIPQAQQRHLMELIERLKASPIAVNTAEANQQHYELPCDFFQKWCWVRSSEIFLLLLSAAMRKIRSNRRKSRMLALTAERAASAAMAIAFWNWAVAGDRCHLWMAKQFAAFASIVCGVQFTHTEGSSSMRAQQPVG